jgi:DNA end-binding protein Ku
MAASLIESMGADFDPTEFHDEYRDAVVELIESKKEHGDTKPAPVEQKREDEGDSMTDLLSALQASVEAARGSSGKKAATRAGAQPQETEEPEEKPARARKAPARASTRRKKADEDKDEAEKKPATRKRRTA